MKLSVIILNYNVRPFLEQCILSVQNALTSIDSEIIVVDNNSEDDSVEMIKKRFPNIPFIANKENFGFSKGNNQGVAIAQGKYVCILNPDTVVAEDTFSRTLQFIENQDNVGIVGVRLVDGSGAFLPESKRGIPTPWAAFGKFTGLYRHLPKQWGSYYATHLSEYETGKVDILVGAFMLMERQLYLEQGGFDEDCFMYSDDIDLSYTVKKSGYDNFYYADTTVLHYKGESTAKDELFLERFREAMCFFYKKHFQGNLFSRSLMHLGIQLFGLKKLLKLQSEEKKANEYKYHLYLGRNKSKLINLQRHFKKIITQIPTEEELPNFLSKIRDLDAVQLIIDGELLSNKEVIYLIQEYSRWGISFRVWPKGGTFIIGGDSSYGRGEVIELSMLNTGNNAMKKYFF